MRRLPDIAPGCVIAVFLLTAGCGGGPELPVLEQDAVILAFGDSLTFGTGAGKDESYPAVLARLTGRRVVNAGVPGEVSSNGLKRLRGELEKHRPTLLILCHGGNDFLRKLDIGQTERNIEAMIGLAADNGAAVLLLGVPRPGLFLNAAELYERAADATGSVYLEDAIPDVLSDNALKSDTVHPNGDGYRRIAEAIYALLQESGAV